jgi:hypothetical protein
LFEKSSRKRLFLPTSRLEAFHYDFIEEGHNGRSDSAVVNDWFDAISGAKKVVLEVRSAEARDSERTPTRAPSVTRAKTNTQIPRTHVLMPRNMRNRNSFVSRRHAPSDWQRALTVISKQWRWSALFAVIVIALATGATFAMKPVYESEGRLQIDPPGAEIFTLDAASAGLIDSEYITTEAQKLQTDDLALHLQEAHRPLVTSSKIFQSLKDCIRDPLATHLSAARV